MILRNTIVAGNVGPTGPDIVANTLTKTASIVGIPKGLTLADILDPAGLADNGGPTQTIALVDAIDNPALEFGDPAICAAKPVGGVDQRGEPRPAGACDIGAFELPTPVTRSPFTDTADSTFRWDIEWLWASGIAKGCTATTYCPKATVTRGQMAAFLDRALDLPNTGTDYFTDDETSTFEANIDRLAEAGITKGCTATTYCPKATVTRGQMAAFLDRALALPLTTTDYFIDDETSTFEAAINRLAASGITKGCTATTYCPKAGVTRGQWRPFCGAPWRSSGTRARTAKTSRPPDNAEDPSTSSAVSPRPKRRRGSSSAILRTLERSPFGHLQARATGGNSVYLAPQCIHLPTQTGLKGFSHRPHRWLGGAWDPGGGENGGRRRSICQTTAATTKSAIPSGTTTRIAKEAKTMTSAVRVGHIAAPTKSRTAPGIPSNGATVNWKTSVAAGLAPASSQRTAASAQQPAPSSVSTIPSLPRGSDAATHPVHLSPFRLNVLRHSSP